MTPPKNSCFGKTRFSSKLLAAGPCDVGVSGGRLRGGTPQKQGMVRRESAIFGKESTMQVSRSAFWTRSITAAMIVLAVTSSVQAQRTRISALERQNFEDILDNNGRRTPGIDLPVGNNFNSTAPINLDRVERRPLINLLKEAVDESELLYKSLRSDAARSPELQGSLRTVTRLRAQAAYFVQDLEAGRSLQSMLPGIQKLNSNWRLTSHQLGQAARISNNSLEIVDRIDRLQRSMEKMFHLEPQLDRRELVNELAGMQSNINNLLEELEYDPRGSDRGAELIYETRKLGQQARHIEDLVLDGDSYDRIVREYNRFAARWEGLLTDLRSVDSRYIRREIRHIADADSRIHDLLWLDKAASREHLRQLANSLIRSVDEFFNRTPLRLVVHLKNVDSILEDADVFYGTVQHFKQSVDANDDDATLMENYGYVEQYGAVFIRSFARLRSSAGRVVLHEIEDGIASLRAELNISGTVSSIDTRKLITTAAQLELLADHLAFDVDNWLKRDREAYRNDALQAMNRFVQRTRRMHRLLQNRPSVAELRRESTDLNNAWSSLYGYLTRCRTEDRDHMIDLARDINSALYDLEEPLQL